MEQREILIRLRKEKGLSQAEVAAELGITRQAISRWEAGRASPSTKKLIALSRLYGVPPQALYYGDIPEETKAEEPEAAPEEPMPEAEIESGDTPGTNKLPLQRKRILLFALAACVFWGTFLWGQLARSKALATIYLIWEVIFFLVAWIIKIVWRNIKK